MGIRNATQAPHVEKDLVALFWNLELILIPFIKYLWLVLYVFSSVHIMRGSFSWLGVASTLCWGWGACPSLSLQSAEAAVVCLASRLSQENTFTEITLKSPIPRAPVSPRAVYFTTLGVSRKAFQQIWFLFETIFGSFVTSALWFTLSGKRMRTMDR